MSYYKKKGSLKKFDVSLSKVVQENPKEEICREPLAISYARVSSDGQDVTSQLQASETWCKKEKIKIVEEFTDEGISGTILDRKWLESAIRFLEKENGKYTKISHFLCSEFSRIARPDESRDWIELVARIEATWAKIVTTLEYRDTSTDEGKLMDDIKFSLARYERKKILKRCKNGMVSLGLSGWWPFGKVAVWYYKTGVKKNAIIHIDEPKAKIISTWLELFANDVLITNADLLNFFKWQWLTTNAKAKTGKLYMSFIEKTFTLHRIFCYGWYFLYPDWWINEPIKGRRPWIISLDVVLKIIRKLQRDSVLRTVPRRTDMTESFPLRWIVLCPSCWRRLTSWYSKSKTGKLHPYYWCSNKFCGARENIPKDLFENWFLNLLNKYKLSDELLSSFDLILKRERKDSQDQEVSQRNKSQWGKVKLENQMNTIEEAMLKTQNPALYKKLEQDRAKLNSEKLLMEEEVHNSMFTEKEFLSTSQKTKWIIYEPLTFWKKATPQIRQLLIGVRFWWDLKYNKNSGYRTPESWVYNCLSRISLITNTVLYPERDSNPHVLTDTRFWV